MKTCTAALGMLLIVAACSKSEQQAPATSTVPAPAPAPTARLSGKVVETFDSGGYTYLRIATAAGEEWAAIPETKIAKGQNVALDGQVTMEKFESKTLGRTFDRIVFASMAGAERKAAAPAVAGSIAVEKPSGGRTVAELWAARSSLNGKEVVVRGKVVKFLPEIMGTNWLHIQDGTGSRDRGDHDLTVTTDAALEAGDVVTLKGIVATNKDFGSGYLYPVIVEKATVTDRDAPRRHP